MSYRDDDDPFEEDIVFDQAGLLSTSRKSGKSTIRRVSSGKCAMFSKTLGLCGAFLGLGLTSAIPGPLSPVPPSILSHDIYLMTYEVMCRCQGFMIGAMFGARLLDRFNRLFLVFLALLVTALLVSIIPWCGIVWLLRTDMFLLGVSFGFLTTGGNVLCLDLWGRNSGPFMQALHFSFSLGVFLAPFLSQPLMTPVNNPLPLSSPAPAMFPLSRLPRDTRNMSSISTGVMLTNTTFAPPEYHPVAGKLSVALLPPTSASSTVEDLGRILKHQPVSKQNASNSGSDSTPSLLANSTTQRLTAGTPLSNVTTQFLNLSAATTVFPAVASPSPLNKSDTKEVGNVSTTTHRTPRPKPVLTNSEKLQDKKWEHEKFRKPPPEDLVPVSPVSTTMKPILRPPNTFAFRNISNVSILSDTISGNNSTTHNINSVKSNTGIPGPQYSLVSLKPVPASSSISKNVVLNSTFISNNSSSLSSRITLDTSTVSAMPLKKPPQIVSEAGITLPNTAKVGISSNSSDAFSLKPTSSTPKTTFSVQDTGKTNNSFNPDLTLKAVTMTPAHQYGRLVSTNSSAGALMGTVGRSNSKKPENMDHIKLSQPSVGKPSFDHKEEKKQKLSARPPHPEFKNMKSSSESHSMEKSISLEEQGLAAVNPPLTVPTVAENEPSLKAPEKLSPLGKGLTAQLTTTKPNIISSHIEDLSQRPFGVSHVKAQGKDNPMGLLVNGHKTADENKTSAEITIKNSSKINATNSGPSSMLKNNASGVSESSSGSDLSASPKHTHHSKPASTVVNDTEVTHTVMDTFANCLEKYGLSRMELVYLTVGMVLLATSLLFLGFLCFNPRDPKSKTDNEEINNHRTRGSNRNRMNSPAQAAVIPSRCLRHALIALMMLLMMITSGVQAMYGQLLLVYAIQSPLQMPQSTGSALTATYWGALTSTRFACILLASALSPTAMLILSLSFCSCATWLLSAFSSSSEAALWIGSVMVSVGTASVFPSGMLWMQRHVSITHRVAAMLVMGPAMGEMFFPSLAYKMMVSLGSASLVHLPALLSLFAIALWAAVWRLARYHRPPLCSHGESSGYHLANQHDEDDLLDLTMSPIVKSNGNFSRNSIHSSGISHRVPQMST